MLGWLRIPPWPPELEPGETVLLEGRSSARRLWVWTGFMAAFGCVLAIALGAAFGDIPAGPLTAMLAGAAAAIASSAVTLALVVAGSHWQFRRNGGWMLTSRRFIQQGVGAIPRDEIGAVKRHWPDWVVVHRGGKDELLKGPKFGLPLLDDAAGVRDALERLK